MYIRYIIILNLFIIISATGCNNDSSEQATFITDEKLLSCLDDTSDVEALNSIAEFTCNDIDLSDAEVSQLSRLNNLKRLTLTKTNLDNLDFLSAINSLEYLNFEENHFSELSFYSPPLDLAPIAGNTNLSFLNLSKNYISDFSSLSGLSMLEELHLNLVYGTGLVKASPSTNHFLGYDFDSNEFANFGGLESPYAPT